MNLQKILLLVAAAAVTFLLFGIFDKPYAVARESVAPDGPPVEKIEKTDAEWKKLLTQEQYRILRKAGTELACSSKLDHNKEKGTYVCAACGLELFRSDDKFDSGTGWPSFMRPIFGNHVEEFVDTSFGIERREIRCARCGSHLGHVFEDGPQPTGLRYCMNGEAMKFIPAIPATDQHVTIPAPPAKKANQ